MEPMTIWQSPLRLKNWKHVSEVCFVEALCRKIPCWFGMQFPISLDTAKRIACVNGEQIPLTKKELSILEYFMLHPTKVISQEELMEHIWNMEIDSFSNAVRVHIATLRKKLKQALAYDPIVTRIGQGYCLRREDTM